MSVAVRAAPLLAGMAALALAAVATALVSQHVFEMMPCPWCALQRLVFMTIAAASLLGLLWTSPPGRRVGAALAGALALCGMAAALWQHFVAAASASCNQTLADRILGFTGLDRLWPEVFAAYASCGESRAALLGVPYEGYSLVLFVLLGAGAWQVLKRSR